MVGFIKDNGNKEKWMDKVYINGLMVKYTMVSILMIKSMALEYLHGRMESNIMVNGNLENSMVKEN